MKGLERAASMAGFVAGNNERASLRQIQRYEHEKGAYADNVASIRSIAMSAGYSKDGGQSIDQAAIDRDFEKKKRGEATPELDAFAAGLANTQFADQLLPNFQFDKVVATPNGDAVLEGEYKAGENAGTRAPMTINGSADNNDEVAGTPQAQLGQTIQNAYTQIMANPLYARQSAEIQQLVQLDKSMRGSQYQASTMAAKITNKMNGMLDRKHIQALQAELGGMTPSQQVVYMRDNILPAMQLTLDEIELAPEEKASIEQTQPDDSEQLAQTQADPKAEPEAEAEAPVDSQTATEIEKLNNELQSLPTGRGGEARRRAIKAKIKSLGASSEAKEFADSEEGSAPPEQVSEEEETGIIAWAKENPVDAAMLAASGLLLLAGPAGWAARGLLTTARATPAATRWIAGQAAKKGPAAARGAVSKPKYKGKPRNAQGQLTTQGNEARQFSAGRAGATGLVLTGASVGIQEVVSENPELENESDATKSAVTKGVNSANDDLVNGKGPSFTQQELDDFAAFLSRKGVTNIEAVTNLNVDEQQTLRAVLAVTSQDQNQRKAMMTQFDNMLTSGDPGLSRKNMIDAQQRQKEIENTTFSNETGRMNAIRLRDDELRQTYESTYKDIDATDKTIRELMFDEDGGERNPSAKEIKDTMFGPGGPIKKLIARSRTYRTRMQKDPNNEAARAQYEIYKSEALAAISYALQARSAEGSLEYSWATDSDQTMSANDRLLSRIAFTADDGLKITIAGQGGDGQSGDAYTKREAAEFFGDRETYNWFKTELQKRTNKRGF